MLLIGYSVKVVSQFTIQFESGSAISKNIEASQYKSANKTFPKISTLYQGLCNNRRFSYEIKK